MRQVPTRSYAASRFLLVGTGKLSRHLEFYLKHLQIPVSVQSSRMGLTPENHAFQPDYVYLLVKDDAIEAVHERLMSDIPDGATVLHASGARTIPGVLGLHPLCTFGQTLYAADYYPTIPWIVASDEWEDARQELSALPNQIHLIHSRDRALYHALCSIAGNFPALLWREVFARFEGEVGLAREVLRPLVEQSMRNAFESDAHLTGPIARGDRGTIEKHLDVLGQSRLKHIYESFLGNFSGESKT